MKDSTVPGIVPDSPDSSSLPKDAPQTKPEAKGFKGLIVLLKKIWDEMNQPLSEEEKKEYDLFLKNSPYNPFIRPYWPYSDFNPFL